MVKLNDAKLVPLVDLRGWELLRRVEVLRAACAVAGIDGAPSEAERKVIDKLAADVGVGRACYKQ